MRTKNDFPIEIDDDNEDFSSVVSSDAIPLSGSWMIKTLSFRRKKKKVLGKD